MLFVFRVFVIWELGLWFCGFLSLFRCLFFCWRIFVGFLGFVVVNRVVSSIFERVYRRLREDVRRRDVGVRV